MPQHIFVTGVPGVGKSTLIHNVLRQLELLPPAAPAAAGGPPGGDAGATATGFWTEEVRDAGGERSGFDIVTLDGRRGPLARAGAPRRGQPAVGKYAVDVAAFERLALPAMQPGPATRLVAIDEVGKMELLSAAFFPAVLEVLGAGVLVLGSVPVPRYGRTIPQVEHLKAMPEVEVIAVTRDNRDQLVAAIAQCVRQALAAPSGS